MEISLEGRVAIVTGGGTGLGRGYARALAGAGAAVAVTGRRREPLEECVAELDKRIKKLSTRAKQRLEGAKPSETKPEKTKASEASPKPPAETAQ